LRPVHPPCRPSIPPPSPTNYPMAVIIIRLTYFNPVDGVPERIE
jgi:hypothetical protein